jgi:3-hydroxybutyryl-CoA dehydrogenase
MRCFVISDDDGWKDLFASALNVIVIRVSREECIPGKSDIIFDLRDEAWDIGLYKDHPDNPIFISAVQGTLKEHHSPINVVRMNGWANMLAKPLIECVADSTVQIRAEEILDRLNKKVEWVPDEPGMVSPRVIAMIVNEAWYALEEGVSSGDDIDIAMQLGTNYPYGPLTWGDKIGLKKIVSLLTRLKQQNPRYEVAESLVKEAEA